MDPRDRLLLEEASSAYRPAEPAGGVREHPAFRDLDAAGRLALFDETLLLRALEQALDPGGLSTTAHAVLARLGITAP